MAKDQLNSNHRGSNNLSSNHHCSKPVELKSPGLKTSWTQITMAQNQLNSNHHGSNKLSPNHNGSINLSSNHHSLKLWLKPGWAQEIFPLTINSAQNLYVQLSLPQLGLVWLNLAWLVSARFLSQLVTALLTKTGNTIDTMNDFDYSWIGEGGTSWIRSAHCLENNWDNFARFCPGCTKVPR